MQTDVFCFIRNEWFYHPPYSRKYAGIIQMYDLMGFKRKGEGLISREDTTDLNPMWRSVSSHYHAYLDVILAPFTKELLDEKLYEGCFLTIN